MPEAAAPLRVLVVDDDEAWVELVARHLRAMKRFAVKIFVAERRSEAVLMIASEAPDVILLDLKLPNGSGLDVLREMQRVANRTPTVMLTGVARDGDEIAAQRAGAQGFMTKDDLMKVGAPGLEREISSALARDEGKRDLFKAWRRLHEGEADG